MGDFEGWLYKYENWKVTAFCFKKDATIEQFIAKLHGIMNKSPDIPSQ